MGQTRVLVGKPESDLCKNQSTSLDLISASAKKSEQINRLSNKI